MFSTYIGGGQDESGYDIGLDDDNNVYITGETFSTDFPTNSPYQTNQTGEDVFVTKFNDFGNATIYSTYLGGTGNEVAHAIDIDNYGSAYITGSTSNDNFPTNGSLQAYQSSLDVFICKLSPGGDALSFGSYLGGNADDIAFGIALDNNSNAYITGYTFSTDYTTLNLYQTDMVHVDAFVTKVEIGSFICGDANGDEGINILDVVYIINYKYKDGPAPEPLESADVDGSANINILDVVYLINFKYKSGPDPNCN